MTPPTATTHAPAITPNATPAFCPLLIPLDDNSFEFKVLEILFSLSASASFSVAGAGEAEFKSEGVGEEGAGGERYSPDGKDGREFSSSNDKGDGEGEGECCGGSKATKVEKLDGRKRIEKNRTSERLQTATVISRL